MATSNSHRAPGRAVTPLRHSGRALRGTGGAAVLGTVLLGSAFAGGAAQAAPAAPASAPAISSSTAAPAAPAPTAALHSSEKLRWGSQGSTVEQLQSALNDEGADLAVDGKFGKLTHGAVKDYQRANGLQIDGVVGPETRGSLNGGASIGGSGTSVPTSGTSTSSSGEAIVDAARTQIGASYSWGSSNPGVSFDCSGLTQYAYKQVGIDLPRTSGQQVAAGTQVSKSEAQPGDLVVWPGHMGIYAGGDKVVDAGRSPAPSPSAPSGETPPSSPSADTSNHERRAHHRTVECTPLRHSPAGRRQHRSPARRSGVAPGSAHPSPDQDPMNDRKAHSERHCSSLSGQVSTWPRASSSCRRISLIARICCSRALICAASSG